MRETIKNAPKVVPNQALYQAEPQPELIAIPCTPVVARVPYFAYFAASGKDAYVNGKVADNDCELMLADRI